jgi:molybdopterin synthase catalytic subunit
VTETKGPVAFAAVTDGELSLDPLVRAVSHGGAGAVVTFAGTVRDTNDGRAVSKLEYEAYASMAAAEIARISREIEAELPGVRVAVQHRTGALAVGDVAVYCAASAPHRGEAFRACRLAIDRVKEHVPIWKREHGPDGPYWVGWVDARCAGEHEHGPASEPQEPPGRHHS